MKINPKGKLQHLIAPDMFEGGKRQVFNAKTGKWIATVTKGNEFNFTPLEEATEPQEEINNNPNQLNLF